MNNFAARRDKYERFLHDCLERAKPDILIWGPGPHDARGYQKRDCIRKAIQGVVRNGDVVFPEDPEIQKLTSEVLGSEDVDDIELLQARNADIIIALDISAAVGEELARYSAYPSVVSKLFVVTIDGNKSGYQKAIRNKDFVRVLEAGEMASCDKPIGLCIKHVRLWCLQKCLRE
jgi:hypothetical protein